MHANLLRTRNKGACPDYILICCLQERNTVAHDLGIEQERNNRMQRDVERFQNREQLLEKVSKCILND